MQAPGTSPAPARTSDIAELRALRRIRVVIRSTTTRRSFVPGLLLPVQIHVVDLVVRSHDQTAVLSLVPGVPYRPPVFAAEPGVPEVALAPESVKTTIRDDKSSYRESSKLVS